MELSLLEPISTRYWPELAMINYLTTFWSQDLPQHRLLHQQRLAKKAKTTTHLPPLRTATTLTRTETASCAPSVTLVEGVRTAAVATTKVSSHFICLNTDIKLMTRIFYFWCNSWSSWTPANQVRKVPHHQPLHLRLLQSQRDARGGQARDDDVSRGSDQHNVASPRRPRLVHHWICHRVWHLLGHGRRLQPN